MKIIRSGNHAYSAAHVSAIQVQSVKVGVWNVTVFPKEANFFVHCNESSEHLARVRLHALAADFYEAGFRLVPCANAYYAPSDVVGVSLLPNTEDTSIVYVAVNAQHFQHHGSKTEMAALFEDFVDRLRRA